MDHIFRLKNPIKYYEWGDPSWIPQLLGKDNKEGAPWAELWMGIHPEGPSEIEYEGKGLPFSDLINRNPLQYLGSDIYSRFGTLPFLFKLLAAGKPLSIQAHPNLAQAQAGWDKENKAEIPLNASNRNYKDPNHKPEILCALHDFRALCGFREPEAISKRLGKLVQFAPGHLQAALDSLNRPLNSSGDTAYRLQTFFRALFNLSAETRQALSVFTISCCGDLLKYHPEYTKEWDLVAYFSELYPGDPGVIAPLYLNIIDLCPEQGIYIPAGVLHAYISGFGVELMANSNNVLRGGLSHKYVDHDELLRILDFTPFHPKILVPQDLRYPIPCKEFSLSILRNQHDKVQVPELGPSIVIVTEGRLLVSDKNGEETCILEQGESAFISARDKPGILTFKGTYTLYAAGISDVSS